MGNTTSRVCVIVPTYNEPPLTEFLDRLAAVIEPLGGEILIVDDSGPRLHDQVRAEAAVPRPVPVRVMAGEHRGKGAAVRRAIAESREDVVFYIDADSDEERMRRIPEFVGMIEKDGYDVVIAERRWKGRTPWRAFLAIALYLLQRWLVFRSPCFFDTQCGFKALRGDIARRMASLQTLDRGLYDLEYLAIAVTHGFRVARVAVEQMPSIRPSRVAAVRLLPADLYDLLRIKRNLRRGLYSP
jgi:glycosyltransferase involved in cell wall biosynthesis